MIFTPLFLVLLGGGLAGLLLGQLFPILYLVVPWCNLALAAAALVDYFFLTPRKLPVARILPPALALGEKREVELIFRNIHPFPLRAFFRDTPPSSFSENGKSPRLVLPPHSIRTVRYEITPYQRGAFGFGPLFLRLEGRLRLTQKQIALPLPTAVDVYPGHRNVRLFHLALRAANPQNYGLQALRRRGEGTDFHNLRDYVPGDDYRLIDWKATARRARFMVREYQEERNQQVMILLDCGRLMSPRAGKLTKLDHAANAALLVAYAALSRGDRVGLLAFSNRVTFHLAMGRGKTQLARINEALKSARLEFYESDYRQAFSFLARRLRRRSLIIVFTEVADEDSSRELLGRLMSFHPRNLPLCVTIVDSDIIAEREMVPDNEDEVFRKAAAAEFLHRSETLFRRMEDRGALVVNAPADRLSLSVLNKYLEIKSRGRL